MLQSSWNRHSPSLPCWCAAGIDRTHGSVESQVCRPQKASSDRRPSASQGFGCAGLPSNGGMTTQAGALKQHWMAGPKWRPALHLPDSHHGRCAPNRRCRRGNRSRTPCGWSYPRRTGPCRRQAGPGSDGHRRTARARGVTLPRCGVPAWPPLASFFATRNTECLSEYKANGAP